MYTLSLHFLAQQPKTIKYLLKNDPRLAKSIATTYLKRIHQRILLSCVLDDLIPSAIR